MTARVAIPFLCLAILAAPPIYSQAAMGSLEKRDPTSAAVELDGRKWFRGVATKEQRRVKFPQADVFEVPASLTLHAVRRLELESGVVELSEKEARWMLGGRYECPNGKRPVLIRAIYVARGSNDPLEVTRVGERQIYVLQQLAGYSSTQAILKTALIVNIDFEVSFVGCGVIFWG